jgi:amidohydrolase
MDPLQAKVYRSVDSAIDELWDIALYLHKNPELSGEEYKAQEKLVSVLEQKGFKCEKDVAGLDTAFTAWSGPPRSPAIAFIAEYDALPKLGHGCGHNLIAASALGAAQAVIEAVPEFSGQVAVFGTPAEEVPEPPAKQLMIDAGLFKIIDVALIMHGSDRTTTGAKSLAVDSVEFRFRGKSSHASKYPHLGASALDAALLTITALEYLREHVRQDVRIHGIVKDGGQRANIVPDTASLHYLFRALDRRHLNQIKDKIMNCAKAGALATGTEVSIEFLGQNDNKVLVPLLDKLLLDQAIAAGAVQLLKPEEELGSTDFGNISHVVPASTLKVAFVPVGTPGHSYEYTKAAESDSGKKAIEVASKAMALAAIQLLSDPALLQQIKKQYKEVKKDQ